MDRRFATQIGAIRANRFARIDSQKKPYVHNVQAIRANRLKTAIRNFRRRETRCAKKAVQFGNPEMIRAKQAFCANLQIDSRESAHLRLRGLQGKQNILIDPPSSEECQKPQPPVLLKKVLQYTSNLQCYTPPICIAMLSVPVSSEQKEILSVLLPFVSQYDNHSCLGTFWGKTLVVAVTGMFPNLGCGDSRLVEREGSYSPRTKESFIRLKKTKKRLCWHPFLFWRGPLRMGKIRDDLAVFSGFVS